MKIVNLLSLFILSVSLLIFVSGCSSPSSSSNGSDDQSSSNMSMDDGGTSDMNREPAPDFTYTSLSGDEYTLSNFNGKVVYIFFFGANCPHCRDNGPATESTIYQPYKNDSNFVALGLDTWNTSASEVESFKEVTGISYPLLLNARESLIDYYGDASKYDRSVVVSPNGNIAYKGTEFVNEDAEKVAEVIKNELAKIE